MTKSSSIDQPQVLDNDTLQTLGAAVTEQDIPADRRQAMHDQMMQRIDEDIKKNTAHFVTVRAGEGGWVEVAPGIHRKDLFTNPLTGAESYLLRAEPGAEAPGHWHPHDEHCLVLEGDVTFSPGTCLRQGDYHFAPANTQHGIARTRGGALVYLQTEPHTQSG